MSGRGRGNSDRGRGSGDRGRGAPRGRGSSDRGGFNSSRPTTPQAAPATPTATKVQIVPYESVKKAKEVKPSGHIVAGQAPGTKGKPVKLVANYMPVVLPEGPFVQYDVKINPAVDSAKKASALLYRFKKDDKHAMAKVTYIYDGKAILYCTKQLPKEIVDNGLIAKDEKTGVTHKISITFTRAIATLEVDATVLQLYNNILRRAIYAVKYQQFGRNFFNMEMARKVEGYNLKVIPGLLSTLKGITQNIMLNADVIFRSLRTDTVFDFIQQCQQQDYQGYQQYVNEILPGTIVLCAYNNRTVPIHGIEWKMTPKSTFIKNNAAVSFEKYYMEHYEIKIKNLNQPMLVSEKLDKQTGKKERMYFVPELCHMTGITDDMREDFHLMKALKDSSGMDPANRSSQTVRFIGDSLKNPECAKILNDWGVSIQPVFTEIQGRVLDSNIITFGANKTAVVDHAASWQIRDDVLYKTVSCDNWAVVCVKGFELDRDNFLKIFYQVTNPLGLKFAKPALIVVNEKGSAAYTQTIDKALDKNAKFLLTILPSNNKKFYDDVKVYAISKRSIINQCVVSRTINQSAKGIHSKVTKLAVQLATKLGAAPWVVQGIKFPNTSMICGVDVYHSGEKGTKKKNSYVGFTASMDPNISSYFSSVVIQDPGKEIIAAIEPCFLNSLKQFQKVNNAYPQTIFFYRDGVGEGQISEIKSKELAGVKSVLKTLGLEDKVKIVYVLVVKRINTRLFFNTNQGFVNPTPGTIVDQYITEPGQAQEFFMVSQHVNQGSATPINYQVILNESGFKSDYIQDLTNKLCHLYYNWFGTIKVPAPCQYAHKIAGMIGQSVQNPEFKPLQPYLFYL